MIDFCDNIEIRKHVREFTKEIHWRKFINVFEEAMKSIPNSHNNTFDFQKIQHIKCKKILWNTLNSLIQETNI
ncbi:hypothetical protein [Tenacibaculum aquimarinum]|uniref:hypothetical protein n=1 Tax=Tenacibaculum aquimarinum TaxID=2910675 RepID=UPI001F0A7586|nr:hypothetical protein [Tenacibaculum aquimarinum]MCH3883680.1 hypothetical protein [Tenacibaculum aquimarinum]